MSRRPPSPRRGPRPSALLSALVLPALLLPACADRLPTGASAIGAPVLAPSASLAAAAAGGLVISQVYGGGGNANAPYTHDFVELFNRSTAPVALDGMSVQYASAAGTGNFGSATNLLVALPAATLQPGQYFLVQVAGGTTGTALPAPDVIGTINMSASGGKVALVTGATPLGCNGGSTACAPEQLARIVDLVGFGGANFFEGTNAAPALSNTTAAIRADAGCTDSDQNGADFAAAAPAPRNTAAPLNPCGEPEPPAAPVVASTIPENGATAVVPSASIGVTFSRPVAVADGWYSVVCTTAGPRATTASGGPATFTLDPDADLPTGETCTVTLFADKVASQDATPLPLAENYSFSFEIGGNACDAPFTPTYAIQGDGATTPLGGQLLTTQGVVVGDFEGDQPALRGFYIQDPTGDGAAETSDGLFVFNDVVDAVSVGDVVRVTGTAGEFQGQTQLGAVRAIVRCGTGAVAPVNVTLPVSDATYLERFEGMLVRLPQTLTVTEHFQLGRFGQVVLSSGGRLAQPTSVAAPGAAAVAVQAANDLNRIILDDARNDQNPDPILFARGGEPLAAANTLRGGDQVTGVVGVLTYTWAGNAASGNAYRVRPVGALGGAVPTFVAANPRPAAPPAVGGTLTVAAMNLLNYFNTFGSGCGNPAGGTATDCRGADNATEFERQAAKTVAAIRAMSPDVLGVIEIENDGYGPSSALADLVARLNAAGAGPYAFVDADAATGQLNALGTDAIKVGLLYKPSRVQPVGATAALNSAAFVNGGDPAPRSRPALAQAFQQTNGGRVVVSVNHLKSKGSACGLPDQNDGQGNCNVVRTRAAQELAAWLAADPTGTGETDVLILGDLNAYAKEDPVTTLLGAGYTDLVARFGGASAYSYVFDGQWGYLDHALASASLASQVTGAAEWHVNADEPSVLDYNTNFKSPAQIASLYAADQYRVADHDPVLVGLDLRAEGPPPPTYDFRGFFAPLENAPVLNEARAGSAIAVSFSLGGDRGLDVFAPGSPSSRAVACPSGAEVADEEAGTAAPGASGLSYDPATDRYTYVWKTEKGWAKRCRELVVRLRDGTEQRAIVRFR